MKRCFPIAALALFGLAFGALATGPLSAQEAKKAEAQVDLVICLDVSNSMDGLIESAKAKLWDVVNELAKAKPTPRLRIALYSYGCPQYGAESGYVRKELDFTTDLDEVYQKLFALRTNGGDEYVARVTQAALDQLKWSEGKALRLIFVCGNEAATQDPKITIENVASQAVKRDVIVNTIHCRQSRGNAADPEAQGWQRLSALAEGRFVSIDQDRGTVAINTPVDKKLAELGTKLNQTFVWYGKAGEARQQNQVAQDANAAKLGASVTAARAASKASTFYRMEGACLVDKSLADPKFDIAKVPEAELPENLRALKPAERVKYIEEKKAERQTLQKEITELSKQRDEFVREYQRKNQGQAERAFDQAIREVLEAQCQKKGMQIQR